jgi:ATP-dependent Zn protease
MFVGVGAARVRDLFEQATLVTEVRPRDKMIVGIMGVMEVDVVAKTTYRQLDGGRPYSASTFGQMT